MLVDVHFNLGVINIEIDGYTFSLRNVLYSKDAPVTLFSDVDLLKHEVGTYYVTVPSGSSFYSEDGTLLFTARIQSNGLKILKFKVVYPVYAHVTEASGLSTSLLHAR